MTPRGRGFIVAGLIMTAPLFVLLCYHLPEQISDLFTLPDGYRHIDRDILLAVCMIVYVLGTLAAWMGMLRARRRGLLAGLFLMLPLTLWMIHRLPDLVDDWIAPLDAYRRGALDLVLLLGALSAVLGYVLFVVSVAMAWRWRRQDVSNVTDATPTAERDRDGTSGV